LENELNSYRTNVIRDSVRKSYTEIGDFYCQRGNYQEAVKSYLHCRDYTQATQHTLQYSLNVIKTSLELGNYVLLSQYIGKAENSLNMKELDIVADSIIKVATGLYNLELKKYKTVAKKND